MIDWYLIIWIILTAIIWIRGWKLMALIPFGLGVLMGFVLRFFAVPITEQLMANIGFGLLFICIAMIIYYPKEKEERNEG